MATRDYYKELSEKVIKNDPEIGPFIDRLQAIDEKVANICSNKKASFILRHPVKVVHAHITRLRLVKVHREFDEYMKAPLVEFFKEESGECQEDYMNAINTFKPQYGRKLVRKLKRFVK